MNGGVNAARGEAVIIGRLYFFWSAAGAEAGVREVSQEKDQ